MSDAPITVQPQPIRIPNYMLPEALDVPKFILASCVGLPTEWWFPLQGQTSQQHFQTLKAIKICHECPEKKKCLGFALDNPQVHGIWGGSSPKKRQRMRSLLGGLKSRGGAMTSITPFSVLLDEREKTHGPLPI